MNPLTAVVEILRQYGQLVMAENEGKETADLDEFGDQTRSAGGDAPERERDATGV